MDTQRENTAVTEGVGERSESTAVYLEPRFSAEHQVKTKAPFHL